MKNNKGFTLIEVMVVLALLAIVAVVAIPMVRNDWKYLDTITQDLLYDLRYAREENMRSVGTKPTIELNETSYVNAKGETINLQHNCKIMVDSAVPSGTIISFDQNGNKPGSGLLEIKIIKGTESKIININELGNIYLSEN